MSLLIAVALGIFLLEIILRYIISAKHISVKIEPRFDFSKMSISDHPYMPFALKKNSCSPLREDAEYPLHKNRFFFPSVKIDHLGLIIDHQTNKPTSIDKDPDTIRICCLGASTTGNVIGDKLTREITSYPSELQKYLKKYSKKNIEVVNCGVGLSNSADLLARYAFQIKDLNPDILVIYHAYNDIFAYLTRDFVSDYSHCRVNLARSYWKFRIASIFPSIPLLSLQILVNKLIPIRGVINNLNKAVSCGEFDLEGDFSEGLAVYKRNLQSIISMCKNDNTIVVLNTFCHYLYESISDSRLHRKYSSIVSCENKIMASLASDNDLLLIDNVKNINFKEELFVDSIHFSVEGMKMLATNIGKEIMRSYSSLF